MEKLELTLDTKNLVEIRFIEGSKLPHLFINGKEVDGTTGNGGILSINCTYKTLDENHNGECNCKVVYIKENEDGALIEQTVEWDALAD